MTAVVSLCKKSMLPQEFSTESDGTLFKHSQGKRSSGLEATEETLRPPLAYLRAFKVD